MGIKSKAAEILLGKTPNHPQTKEDKHDKSSVWSTETDSLGGGAGTARVVPWNGRPSSAVSPSLPTEGDFRNYSPTVVGSGRAETGGGAEDGGGESISGQSPSLEQSHQRAAELSSATSSAFPRNGGRSAAGEQPSSAQEHVGHVSTENLPGHTTLGHGSYASSGGANFGPAGAVPICYCGGRPFINGAPLVDHSGDGKRQIKTEPQRSSSKDEVIKQLRYKLKDAEKELKKRADYISKAHKREDELASRLLAKTQEATDLDSRIKAAGRKHEIALQQSEQNRVAEVNLLAREYAEEIKRQERDLKQTYQDRETELRQAHHKRETELRQDYDRREMELRQAHSQREMGLQSAIQHYQTEKAVSDSRHETETDAFKVQISRLKTEHAEEVASHEAAMIAIKEIHREEAAAFKKKAEDDRLQLQQKHQLVEKKLRANIAALNEGLLARDDVKYHGAIFTLSSILESPDDQIRDRFIPIRQLVDDVSRLSWKERPNDWPDALIQEVTGPTGPRVVKKDIVQDMLWTVLFRCVFCSPFRMFGEEGKKLEKEWSEQCGKGEPTAGGQLYAWPPPSIKAERWRYMTMNQCREILAAPKPSDYDKRGQVRQGFRSSINRLVSELKVAAASVAEVGPSEVQTIQKLSSEASKMWLDFCMHRCRIVIRPVPSEFSTAVEKAAAARNSSVTLTVRPEVGRYGTGKGVDLDTFTTISGCASESITLPERASN